MSMPSIQLAFFVLVANQALFIYELLNFAVDGLVLLLYVKIAICSRQSQFASAIS
jgi:hypothetical protein